MLSCEISLSSGRIHYLDTGGDGPAIVLVHGNSQSAEGFRPLLESSLSDSYRLIAPDLPGHGESDMAINREATYCFSGFGKILVEFAQALNLSEALWFGHSLGGHILLNAWPALPKPAGMSLCGTGPIGNPPDVAAAYNFSPLSALLFEETRDPHDTNKLFQSLCAPGTEPSSVLVESFLKTDPKVRSLLGKVAQETKMDDEAGMLRDSDIPIAVFQGQFEELVNLDYLKNLEIPRLWGGEITLLEGARHMPHQDTPEGFSRVLSAFADDVFKLVS